MKSPGIFPGDFLTRVKRGTEERNSFKETTKNGFTFWGLADIITWQVNKRQ
jgi:hypothetical protein